MGEWFPRREFRIGEIFDFYNSMEYQNFHIYIKDINIKKKLIVLDRKIIISEDEEHDWDTVTAELFIDENENQSFSMPGFLDINDLPYDEECEKQGVIVKARKHFFEENYGDELYDKYF